MQVEPPQTALANQLNRHLCSTTVFAVRTLTLCLVCWNCLGPKASNQLLANPLSFHRFPMLNDFRVWVPILLQWGSMETKLSFLCVCPSGMFPLSAWLKGQTYKGVTELFPMMQSDPGWALACVHGMEESFRDSIFYVVPATGVYIDVCL